MRHPFWGDVSIPLSMPKAWLFWSAPQRWALTGPERPSDGPRTGQVRLSVAAFRQGTCAAAVDPHLSFLVGRSELRILPPVTKERYDILTFE